MHVWPVASITPRFYRTHNKDAHLMPRTATNLPPTDIGLKRLANATTDVEILAAIAATGKLEACRAVAFNALTTPDILRALSSHGNLQVRAAVARSANAPTDVVAALLNDPHPAVRKGASIRDGLTAEQLDALTRDPDMDVRAAVSYRSGLTTEMIIRLANDPSPAVQVAVGRRSALPDEAVLALARSQDQKVQDCVAWVGGSDANVGDFSPGLLLALSQGGIRGRRRVSRVSGDLPDAIYTALAADSDPYVRWNLVDRHNLPAWVLLILADDKDLEVRSRTSMHPNAGDDALAVLAAGRSSAVAHKVWKRTHGHNGWMPTHPDVKIRLRALEFSNFSQYEAFYIDPDAKVRSKLVEMQDGSMDARLAKDADPLVRKVVAQHTRNPEVLATLTQDHSDIVRTAVAKSTRITPALLSALAEDPVTVVRKAAMDTLLNALSGPNSDEPHPYF